MLFLPFIFSCVHPKEKLDAYQNTDVLLLAQKKLFEGLEDVPLFSFQSDRKLYQPGDDVYWVARVLSPHSLKPHASIFVQSIAVRNLIWSEKYPEYGISGRSSPLRSVLVRYRLNVAN